MISPLMVSSKNVKVSQKRCLGTSIKSFSGSSPSEQIIAGSTVFDSTLMLLEDFEQSLLSYD